MKLTDTAIRSAKPRDKQYSLADGRGLSLLVTSTGGKWWRFRYRINGKAKMLSLGTYPDISLKTARERTEEARKLVADDIDPSKHRKAQRNAQAEIEGNSFESVAREWHSKYSHTWVESHGIRIIRRLERDIFPWLGKTAINEITSADLLKTLERIQERGALETAHRALQNCAQIFRYAGRTGKVTSNPASDMRGALIPVKKNHFAAVTEPHELGKLLATLHSYSGTLPVKCALKLAPLVFVRPGELRHAKWADIDLDAAEWRYTVTKTNPPHVVPLAKQAIKILQELLPLTGGGIYVFPSARSPKGDRPMSDNAILAAMRRMDIEKEEMTGHGFRAAARTILDEHLGFRPDIIEHQLAHAVRDTNGRAYNRTKHLEDRKKMMQAWADYLDDLRKSNTRPCK